MLIFLLSSLFQPTPIFLLPKLEYQAYYGVEALTESEVCQLWTQSMLHSKSLFYIGKFDVLNFCLIHKCVSICRITEKILIY